MGDVQNQLTQSEIEMNKALDRNKSFDDQRIQLENQIKDFKQEIDHLRTNMAHLDHEKDQLLVSVIDH